VPSCVDVLEHSTELAFGGKLSDPSTFIPKRAVSDLPPV
jgi:hypothetical protein